ncbi:MAG TPA: ATP synthase F0 subunit C [Candidatus Scalindua sp.]|jgi:F-type H+-transporting ATPase subunit c|nr:ATP synthase F0 subunit C [Candidatus Scalindua sp.]|tara:strand:- start:294 stop:533 length:240 start_codon:yes stop_codon:yes gene_type:complete
MDSTAAALIGMGLAAVGFAGSGVGIGYIFGKMIESVARQPEAEAKVGKYMWIGFALVEAIALYGLVIAFIIMGMKGGEG